MGILFKSFVLIFLSLHLSTIVLGQASQSFWTKTSFTLENALLDSENDKSLAAGLLMHYFVKDHIAIGPSLTFYNFESTTKGSFLNYGVDAIFTLLDSKYVSFYASMGTGYGNFNIDNNYDPGAEVIKKGGIYFNPNIGLIITTAKDLGLKLGFGYLQQSLLIDYPNEWQWAPDISLKIKRLRFSIGVIF